MERIPRGACKVDKSRFPRVLTETTDDLRRKHSAENGMLIVAWVTFNKLPDGVIFNQRGPTQNQVHRIHTRFMHELSIFAESHGVLFPPEVFHKGFCNVIFDDQHCGMEFSRNFPSNLGGVVAYRNGSKIIEKHAKEEMSFTASAVTGVSALEDQTTEVE